MTRIHCTALLFILVRAIPPNPISNPGKRDNHDNSQVCLCSTNKRSKLPLNLPLHFLKGYNGSRLLAHNISERNFTLHDDAGDTHLANNELDGVDVLPDDGERGSLGDDVVGAVFEEEGYLGVLLTTTKSEVELVIGKSNETREGNGQTLVSFSSSSAADAAVAVKLLLQLGATRIQQLEQLRSSSLVQGIRELARQWRVRL